MPRFFVITGLSGTGKSTTLEALRTEPTLGGFRFRDLDDDGVPSRVDNDWRVERAHSLLANAELDARAGNPTVVAGTFLPTDFARSALNVRFCLLRTSAVSIRKRLLARYASEAAAAGLHRAVGFTPVGFIQSVERNREGFERAVLEHPEVLCIDTATTPIPAVCGRIVGWLRAAA